MNTQTPENTATVTLPESGVSVTLRRAEIIHWIQREKTPQWYAHLYLQRGAGKIDGDAMTDKIATMDAGALYEIMRFHNFLVKYAVNGQLDLDEVSEADYNVILRYAQTGSTPEAEEKGESEAVALETFRAGQ